MRDIPRRLGGLYVVVLLAALMVTALPLPAFVPQAQAQAQACTDLIVDGGFETGGIWLLGPSPVMPQYVTYAKHSGNRSLLLGITSGANVESFSSARQTVIIPASAGPLTLSFWAYTMADAPRNQRTTWNWCCSTRRARPSSKSSGSRTTTRAAVEPLHASI